MKGTKFFGIGIALAACVLLLAVEAGFISVAWAKPPQPTTFYGYAILRDDVPNDKIWSDGKGQYVDNHIVGGTEYYVTLQIQSGDLVRSDFKCGWPPSSTRRVLMVLSGSTQVAPSGSTEENFLTILLGQTLNNPLNPIAHLQGGVSITKGTPLLEYVDFIVDTITREDLWAAGILDDVLTKYKFSSYTGLAYEKQHLIYGLDYEGATVTEIADGKTWTIVPYGSPVNLFVYKKQGKNGAYKPAVLATYPSLPFGWTTSLESILAAPRKHNTLSVTWGKIKEK